MQKKAGSIISRKDPKFSTREYVLGDMSSTVYPVGGGLEDWGYGASWDQESGATIAQCKPEYYPLTFDMSFESQKSVKSLIYLIETADQKKPPEWTLGGRYLTNGTISGIYD